MHVFALLLTSAVATTPPAPADTPPSGPMLVDDAGEEPWLADLDWGRLFPLSEVEPQHPVVQDNATALYWTSCLLGVYAGPLWIPQTVTGVAPGPGYGKEAMLIWLSHALPLIFFPLAVVPIIGCGFIAFAVADLIYFLPIAITAAYDRSLTDLPAPAGIPAPAPRAQRH